MAAKEDAGGVPPLTGGPPLGVEPAVDPHTHLPRRSWARQGSSMRAGLTLEQTPPSMCEAHVYDGVSCRRQRTPPGHGGTLRAGRRIAITVSVPT